MATVLDSTRGRVKYVLAELQLKSEDLQQQIYSLKMQISNAYASIHFDQQSATKYCHQAEVLEDLRDRDEKFIDCLSDQIRELRTSATNAKNSVAKTAERLRVLNKQYRDFQSRTRFLDAQIAILEDVLL